MSRRYEAQVDYRTWQLCRTHTTELAHTEYPVVCYTDPEGGHHRYRYMRDCQ